MKGSETKLVSYMQGSDKRFVIPVYQRNYDWKTENCKQLYDDLIKVIRRGRKSHFFGSIVSVHNDGEFNEYLVIDGQQRLTTIAALKEWIQEAKEILKEPQEIYLAQLLSEAHTMRNQTAMTYVTFELCCASAGRRQGCWML